MRVRGPETEESSGVPELELKSSFIRPPSEASLSGSAQEHRTSWTGFPGLILKATHIAQGEQKRPEDMGEG